MKQRVLVSRVFVPETKPSESESHGSRLTATHATIIAAFFSLLSATATAWLTGAFEQQTAVETSEITSAAETAIASLRLEADAKIAEIKQAGDLNLEQEKIRGNLALERFKLQRDLILRAIEASDRDEGRKRLVFFARTGLIPDFAEDVIRFTEDQDTSDIPSFTAPQDLRQELPSDVQAVASVNLTQDQRRGAERVFVLMGQGQEICNAIWLVNDLFLVPEHCHSDDLAPFSIKRPDWLQPKPVEFVRGFEQEEKGPYGNLLSYSIFSMPFLRRDASDIGREELGQYTMSELNYLMVNDPPEVPTIRAPEREEQAYMIGWLPTDRFKLAVSDSIGSGLRAAGVLPVLEALRTRTLVIDDQCQVKEVREYSTDTTCISTIGMSGAPIFSARDGSLLSFVAFGDGDFGPTGGPVLNGLQEFLDTVVSP